MACTVVISIQKTDASIVIQLVLTEGRPPGQRPSLSHAAIRQKKEVSDASGVAGINKGVQVRDAQGRICGSVVRRRASPA